MSPRWLLALPLGGCFVTPAEVDAAKDRDGDGFRAVEAGGEDCDDSDPAVHPGALELCTDAVDSDCDGALCPAREEVRLDPDQPWLAGDAEGALLRTLGPPADLDGDGHAELLLWTGADSENRVPFMVHAVPFPVSTAPTTLAQVTTATVQYRERIERADAVGDLDGDGDEELLVATLGDEPAAFLLDDLDELDSLADAGELPHLRFDAWTDPEDQPDLSTLQIATGMGVGVGDWDGDGRSDFAVGDGGHGTTAGALVGAVFLITEPWTGAADAGDVARVVIEGTFPGGGLGTVLARGTDLNNDGLDDLIAHQPGHTADREAGYNGTDLGASFGFTETPGGTITTAEADVAWFGEFSTSRMSQPSTVGDLNGDGADDVAVTVQSGGGLVALYYGPLSGLLTLDNADHRLIVDAGGEQAQGFGDQVQSPGDVDGDGFRDLIVDVTIADRAGLDDPTTDELIVGGSYLFRGPISGVQLPEHAAVRWEGCCSGSPLSTTLADLDENGVQEVIFSTQRGAPGGELDALTGVLHVLPLW
jgi:hypothetical protein